MVDKPKNRVHTIVDVIGVFYMDSGLVFHPKFCDTHSSEYYCMMQYIHYTTTYLPRFVDIDVSLRC